jgi:hypothetical protein
MFGGGAGHIADMIGRIKANRALLKKRRYFTIMSNFKRTGNNAKIESHPLSESERKVLIAGLKEVRRRSDMKKLLALLLSIAITLYIVLLILSWLKLLTK